MSNKNAQELIQRINDIESFEQVNEWDAKAKEMVQMLKNSNDSLSLKINELEKKKQSLLEDKNKSFFSKLLNSNKDEIFKIDIEISSSKSQIGKNNDNINSLNMWIQITPDDKNEKSNMINELKENKKDIALQKKELRLAIKETNKNARISNAKAINQRGFSSYKLVSFQQAVARSRKELQLAPLEEQLQQLEFDELQYDKVIRFLEKIN